MAATMPWTKAILLLPLVLLQLLCVNGYFIDKSCKEIENKIKLSMKKAMQMAENAAKEIDGDNDNIKELRGWFFRDEDVGKAKQIYNVVQAFKTLDQPDTNNVKQPTIYCNLDRFEENTGNLNGETDVKYLVNKDEGIVQKWDQGYQGCKDGTTIAYTSTIQKWEKKYLMIQLCPWYLNQALSSTKFTNPDGSLPDVSGLKSYDPKRDFSEDDPQADVWSSQLDFTLLHELTHALPGGFALQGDPAYDWKPCVELGLEQGCMNPDSYAFFALGVRTIRDKHLKFNKKGIAVALDDATTKRSEQAVIKRWSA